METPVTIICMKWGSMYGPEYVNHLREGVSRHLRRPHRFVCFTDDATGLRPDVEVQPLPPLGLPGGHQAGLPLESGDQAKDTPPAARREAGGEPKLGGEGPLRTGFLN